MHGQRVRWQKKVQKTKETENSQIHVVRAINSRKYYKILKGTLHITMTQHVDKIVLACAALYNITDVLIQIKKN